MLPGYFYHLVARLSGGLLRLGPAIFGMGEILLVGLVGKKMLSARAGLIASALLAVCPWHFYYSRILGTCTGVIFWGLLTIYLSDGSLRILSYVAGLFHYTTYRLILLKLVSQYVIQRRSRSLLYLAGGLGIALAGLFICEASVKLFFTRGTYNFVGIDFSLFQNYLRSLLMPFVPVAPGYVHTTRSFMADYVHTGLAISLGGIPPMGLGFAALSAVALCCVWKTSIKYEALFVLLVWLVLGFMGPSFSRFLIVLPFLSLASAAFITQKIPLRWQGSVVLLVLITTGFSLFPMLARLRSPRLEAVFHNRYRYLSTYIEREIKNASKDSVYVLTDYGYRSARYWHKQSDRYTLLPSLDPADLERLMNYTAADIQYLIADSVPLEADVLSGYDQSTRRQKAWSWIRSRATIIEEKPIEVDGTLIGHVLVLRWPYRLFEGVEVIDDRAKG